MVFDVSSEMQSDSKYYVIVQDDEITELVHTAKSDIRLHQKLEIVNRKLQEAYFEPNEKLRCLFGIAKRLYKLLWICTGRNLQACA